MREGCVKIRREIAPCLVGDEDQAPVRGGDGAARGIGRRTVDKELVGDARGAVRPKEPQGVSTERRRDLLPARRI